VSKGAARQLAPRVTVTHEKNAPVKLAPKKDPVQSAWGNGVASTIVFDDPLVVTAKPPSSAGTIVFTDPLVVTAEPPKPQPQPDKLEMKTETFDPPVTVPRKDGVIEFEPDLITAKPPEEAGKDETLEDPGEEKKPPTEIAKEGAKAIEEDVPQDQAEAAEESSAPTDAVEKEADAVADTVIKPEKPKAEKGPPGGAGGGGGDGASDLSGWKARVGGATAATPQPTLGDAPAAKVTVIQGAGKSAAGKHKSGGGKLAAEADKAVRKPPETPKQLPPPPPTAVPEADRLITEASDKKMPNQDLPQLVQRPADPKVPDDKPTMPVLDSKFSDDLGTKLTLPPPEPAAEAAAGEKKPTDKKQLDKLKDAKAKPPEENRKGKAGEKLTLEDITPAPTPGIEVGTKGQSKEKVAQVLAELLRSPGPEGEAEKIVSEARAEAYPRKALEMEWPEVGTEKKGEVLTELKTQVDSIRAIAGITGEELDAAIKTREETLKALESGARVQIDTAREDAKTETKEGGEKAKEDVAGARDAVDENILQKTIAATGETDPTVIEMRRDKGLRDLARRAARQDVFYEKAGDRRVRALDASHQRMRNAYKDAATADQKKIYQRVYDTEKKAKKPETEAAATASQQSETQATPFFEWAGRQTRELVVSFGALKDDATATAKKYRDAIKKALEDAKEMVRAWAEDRIARQESLWDWLIRKYQEWTKEAKDDSAAWEEARNEQLRDTLVGDLKLIDDLDTAAREHVDMKTFIQERGLDQAQMGIMQTYFAGVGPEGKKQLDSIGAVAAGMRMRVRTTRKPGLIDWMKSEVIKLPDEKWQLMGRIGNAEKPPFNVVALASDLFHAMDQWGTDEDKIYGALAGLTPIQSRALRARYQYRYHRSLDEHLDSEMGGAELTRAEALLAGNQTAADVATLYEAMHGGLTGLGTDEDAIMLVLRNKTKEERDAIIEEYRKRYGIDLNRDLKSELDDGWSSHHDFDRSTALMEGNVGKADAIALDAAMHGGVTGAGTDEGEITRVYEQNRAEVEAEGARRGWSSERIKAEVLKRNQSIEKEYEGKYGDPTQLDKPSALRRAFGAELSDAEEGLANALADGDLTAIDAAKLGVEKQSFITSDETVNKILQSQGQRARKDVERDLNHDLEYRAEVDSLRGCEWKPERWNSERTAMKSKVEDETQKRALQYMSNLETKFDKEWGGGKGGLTVMIVFNMSGDDQKKAYDLKKQGGILKPEQEIFYAVSGVGTDLDKLKEVLKGKSPDEVKKIREAWNAKYKDSEGDFDSRVLEEVGGRDYQDMKWALDGEPQDLKGKVARAKERMEYEESAYGVWGDFTEEKADIQDQYLSLAYEKTRLEDMDKFKGDKKAGESDEAYQARLDKVAYWEDSFKLQEGYFDRAIEDHRTAVDSFADTAATIAGIVAVVVVMVVVGIATGGTGAAAIGAALASAKVAAAGAIAAAAATIATKALIKGSTYSHEELAVDAIVGAVDAVASAMTAGVGGGLLKAARAGAPASRLAGFAAKSKLAAGLSKMATSERMAARIFAGAMAEGLEGVASSLPSALAGNMLDEKNWVHGNPLANILAGTAIQTGMGAVVSAGMGGLGGIGKEVEAPKLRETGDVLAKRGPVADRMPLWKAWQAENPGKQYDQFLEQLDAGIIAKDVDESARKAMQREMRTELLAEIPGSQRKQFADVPIEVMSDADFEKFTRSASGQAVVIFKDGKPMVILREGADLKALREEGIHLVQSKDPKWAKKFMQLDEARLVNWEKLPLDEQLALYRTKLDIEIDAQQRLLKSLDDQMASATDPALRKTLLARRDAASKTFENLSKRLDEVTGLSPLDKLKIARKEMDPPQYLDQKPRLFSKLADEEQDALGKLPKGYKVEPPKVVKALAGEFDDAPRLQALSTAASNYDSRIRAAGKGSAELRGSVRGRVFLFVGHILEMATTSKSKAALLLKSSLEFFDSVTITTLAPFLRSAPLIYKEIYNSLESVGDTLFDNLQRIAASNIFGTSKIGTIAKALDEILDSATESRFLDADKFVREIRDSVGSWDKFQKQLSVVRKLTKDGDTGDLLKGAQGLADTFKKEFDDQLAKLDGFGITDKKLLDEMKKEVQNTGKWDWAKFRAQQGKDFAQPTSFAKLEQLITTMANARNWDPADIGPIRRWAGVLQKLDESLEGAAATGPNLQKFFAELTQQGSPFKRLFGGGTPDFSKGTPQQKLMHALGEMFTQFETGYKAGTYDKLRYFVRDAVIAAAMDQPNPGKQFAFLQDFLGKLRKFDSASVGEYFSAFRRAILEGSEDLPARGHFVGVKGLPDAKRALKAGQKGRMADGAAKIGRDLSDTGPFAGSKSLIEDKAGKSFDESQALNYSDILKASEKEILDATPNPAGKLKPPSIPTGDGDFHGVIYFFENLGEAKKKADLFDKLGIHWAVQVAAFDPTTGTLKMVPRPKAVTPNPARLDAYKEWLKPPR